MTTDITLASCEAQDPDNSINIFLEKLSAAKRITWTTDDGRYVLEVVENVGPLDYETLELQVRLLEATDRGFWEAMVADVAEANDLDPHPSAGVDTFLIGTDDLAEITIHQD